MSRNDVAAPLPLVLVDGNGAILDLLLQNHKGFAKSLEHHELWVIHPETGRLLPDGRAISQILDRGRWYEATAATEGLRPPAAAPLSPRGDSTAAPEARPANSSGHRLGAILDHLVAVIADRKASMPEGSYTTHLFASGGAKIRKKTGEEAVELLLAENEGELVHEASDLIYHLLVLLANEEIDLDQISDELDSRG